MIRFRVSKCIINQLINQIHDSKNKMNLVLSRNYKFGIHTLAIVNRIKHAKDHISALIYTRSLSNFYI
jgi:hypothetical protein